MLIDGSTETGRLAESDGARDDGGVEAIREVFFDLIDDLAGKVGAPIVHGHEDAFMAEVGIGSGALDLSDDVDDFGKTFKAEPFALERCDDFVRGGEGGGHEDAERGRRIENADVEEVLLLDFIDELAEANEVTSCTSKVDFSTGEIHVSGDDGEIVSTGGDDVIENSAFADQRGVEAHIGGGLDAEPAGGIGLRIKVDEENALSEFGKSCGQVNGGSGFSHTSFLVGNGDDSHRRDYAGGGEIRQTLIERIRYFSGVEPKGFIED